MALLWAKQFSIIDPFYVEKYICVWIQCVLQNHGHKKHWAKHKKRSSKKTKKTINVLKLLTKVMKSLKYFIDFIYFSYLTSNNLALECSWNSNIPRKSTDIIMHFSFDFKDTDDERLTTLQMVFVFYWCHISLHIRISSNWTNASKK